ncbi:MAG: OsmC family protein [Bacteroidetes bacterium]|nr:OsmC family protein [Bacteroidota bacterium]
MHISDIEYSGELRTTAVHLRSGKVIITDAPPDNNGKGEAFSPTDLMSTSLGSCMLTIMGIIAARHQIDLRGTKVSISKFMGTDPRRVTGIKVEMKMPALELNSEQKRLLENAALTCPVAKSLHPDIKQDVTFQW